jgi:bacterioferritin (cytochrome b1)
VLCGDVRDYATREILESILKDGDKHIDGIEEVQDQISQWEVRCSCRHKTSKNVILVYQGD